MVGTKRRRGAQGGSPSAGDADAGAGVQGSTVAGKIGKEEAQKAVAREEERVTKKDESEELVRLRRLLDDANKCMVDFAKEYKRLHTIVESYKADDHSLLCTSQFAPTQGSQEIESDIPSFSQVDAADSSSASQLEAYDLVDLSQMSDLLDHMDTWGEQYKSFRWDGDTTSCFPESAAGNSSGNDRATTQHSHSSTASQTVVRTGVACVITSDEYPGCVLTGKRKGSHGAGLLALPGGHLEVGETWEGCAMREIKEETGLDVPVPKFAWVSNNPDMEGGRHYTTIFMQSKVGKGSLPLTMEPEKCEEWKWKSWSELKGECESGTLFQPLATVLKTEYDPFSSKVGVP